MQALEAKRRSIKANMRNSKVKSQHVAVQLSRTFVQQLEQKQALDLATE